MDAWIDIGRTGEENMRIDAEMLRRGDPAVRVYGWRPAAISIGYTQSESVIDTAAARRLGVDVVRRPTGGGALLHDVDEVTYAVVMPRAAAPRDVAVSYRLLSAGVLETLRSFGVEADYVEGRGGDAALCYMRDEGISIAVAGRKISGGAQKRTRTAILQHGTLLVDRDADAMADLVRGSPHVIRARTTCLAEEVAATPSWREVASRVLSFTVAALKETTHVTVPGRLNQPRYAELPRAVGRH